MEQFVGINTTYSKCEIWYLHSTVVTLDRRFKNFKPQGGDTPRKTSILKVDMVTNFEVVLTVHRR
jgi:hypothetical protein